jgi:hypothetical protein
MTTRKITPGSTVESRAAESVCAAANPLVFAFLILAAAISAAAADVKLAWDPNSETDLAGYNLYLGRQSRVYSNSIKLGKVTAYTLSGLPPGTYYFALTAFNTAGLESGYSNEVSTTIPASADTTPPSIAITAPVNVSTYVTTSSVLTVSGTASDSVGVTQVSWVNSAGGSGIAAGTTSWSANIPLVPGTNVITVTASDAAGNTARATLTVTYIRLSSYDLNGDGVVDVLDLQLLTNVILGAPCSGRCDLNGDGKADVLDLQLMTNRILGVGTTP